MTLTAKKSRKKKIVVSGFTAFLLFVLAFVIFLRQNFTTVEVKGPSMEPTFSEKDHVLVSKAYWLVGDLRRGDIVVVRREDGNGENIIKRINRLGGESVDFMNLPSNYTLAQGEFIVPEDEYYILGDNRPVSEDSREFGPISKSEIIGKVIIIRFGIPSGTTANASEE